MFRFAEPTYLYLLLFVPLLIAFHLFVSYQKKKAIKEFGDLELMEQLMPDASRSRVNIKMILLLLAIMFFALLMARPQFGSKLETVKREGIEVVIALDISNSMLAKDVQPSRLEKAKRIVSQLIDKMENDKLGIVLFAGDAYTQLPMTHDFISAKMFLETISPSLISKQGTSLGAAINLANNSFTQQEGIGRTIIIITDGENHEGGVEQATKEAVARGIQVNVLGIGSPEGAPIPDENVGNDYRKDREGNVVITRLNEDMCREIDETGNGIYARVDNSNAAQRAIENEIEKLAKSEIETRVYTEYNEQFQIIAWIIFLLLLTELIILERKNSLLKNIHLFSVK